MFKVHIKFSRIQTYLFSIPRLSIMVGANSLLGETIRFVFVEMVQNYATSIIESQTSFPVMDDDPIDDDHPCKMYEMGILSRDGGHFSVVFKNEKDASSFSSEVTCYLHENLPGLKFQTDITQITNGEQVDKNNTTKKAKLTSKECVVELPQFAVCEESRNGPAHVMRDSKLVSNSVAKRKEAYKDFKRNLSCDITQKIHEKLGFKNLPQSFEELCPIGYMATIHVDGNSMGKRYRARMENYSDKNFIKREIYGEQLWHSMRTCFRAGLYKALQKTFSQYNKNKTSPYQLLMLGGDDLLLVCRAGFAFDFITHFALELKSKKLVDGNPLTIGAGIVISRPNFPFHQLHSIAEHLAESAKHLNVDREISEYVSTIDWLVTTNSWHNDPILARKQEKKISYQIDQAKENLLLTSKPYPILGDNSLESLCKISQKFQFVEKQKIHNDDKDIFSRSQLHKVLQHLKMGRRYSSLIFDEMASSTAKIMQEFQESKKLWHEMDEQYWKTYFEDFMEIYEIQRGKECTN